MSEPAGASHALYAHIWERANPEIIEGKFYACYAYDGVTGGVKFHWDTCTATDARMFESMCRNTGHFFRLYPCE